MQERRRFPRYDSALEVRYTTTGNAAIESHSVTKNISRVGICMPVSRIIKKGDVINVDIDPNDKAARVSALARVVWTRPFSRPALLELDAGLEFIKLEPTEAERLLQTIY